MKASLTHYSNYNVYFLESLQTIEPHRPWGKIQLSSGGQEGAALWPSHDFSAELLTNQGSCPLRPTFHIHSQCWEEHGHQQTPQHLPELWILTIRMGSVCRSAPLSHCHNSSLLLCKGRFHPFCPSKYRSNVPRLTSKGQETLTSLVLLNAQHLTLCLRHSRCSTSVERKTRSPKRKNSERP